MINQDLANYIQNCQKEGFRDEEVIEALKQANWAETLIWAGFKAIQNYSPVSQPTINQPEIIIENISKSFKEIQALKEINLTVEPNTITALLGPNGAGKTTLIRILTTLLRPDSGHAQVAGFDVTNGAKSLRQNIGLAGQNAAIDENLTGWENLNLVGRLYHLNQAEVESRVKDLIQEFDLSEFADRLAKTYSGGIRKRLDLAASLVGKPRILFLDEPTTGLDPRSRRELWRVIKKLRENGTTILLTTQYLEEADQLADKITIIDHGRIIAQGTSRELKEKAGADTLDDVFLALTGHRAETEAMDINV